MNQKETICPLLTTNTVIGENGQVSIGMRVTSSV